jgi:hypothetical protein
MSPRSRLPIAVSLLCALTALLSLVGVGSAGALPKKFSVVQRNVAIKASGTLTYRWTFDNRSKCVPGYSKTIEEELRFDFPTRRTQLAITFGHLAMPPMIGGSGSLDVRVGGWQTTNYCPPDSLAPEPEQPNCKSGSSPVVVGISNTIKDVPIDDDDPVPLGRESQIVIARTKGLSQNLRCGENRPSIPFEFKDALGWYADPAAGVVVGMNAPTSAYAKLTNGKTLRRQINISGGCGGASAHASAIPSHITSCTLDGVIFVTVTGLS